MVHKIFVLLGPRNLAKSGRVPFRQSSPASLNDLLSYHHRSDGGNIQQFLDYNLEVEHGLGLPHSRPQHLTDCKNFLEEQR